MGLWDRVSRFFRATEIPPEDPRLEGVQQLLGYQFRDRQLLLLGLTHRSYARSTNHDQQSNERLEFLGDSVLGLIISDQLFKDNPGESEGNLTKTKAMLVNETTLCQLGKEIGLNKFIRLSAEEDRAGGRERASIISAAFEAVIGAVYLDGGIDAARDIVLRSIYTRREKILTDTSQRNYKGDLLELIQAKGEGVPRYDVVSEEGPDHEKTFHVIVTIGVQKVGEGVGYSKKEADQKAASEALETLEK